MCNECDLFYYQTLQHTTLKELRLELSNFFPTNICSKNKESWCFFYVIWQSIKNIMYLHNFINTVVNKKHAKHSRRWILRTLEVKTWILSISCLSKPFGRQKWDCPLEETVKTEVPCPSSQFLPGQRSLTIQESRSKFWSPSLLMLATLNELKNIL